MPLNLEEILALSDIGQKINYLKKGRKTELPDCCKLWDDWNPERHEIMVDKKKYPYEVHGMGVALGMKENLSYHMARHSFGTLTLTAGIPIESIARMMGHTNIDSTQVYAQVTDRKISSDMNRLMERRKPAAGKEAAG